MQRVGEICDAAVKGCTRTGVQVSALISKGTEKVANAINKQYVKSGLIPSSEGKVNKNTLLGAAILLSAFGLAIGCIKTVKNKLKKIK